MHWRPDNLQVYNSTENFQMLEQGGVKIRYLFNLKGSHKYSQARNQTSLQAAFSFLCSFTISSFLAHNLYSLYTLCFFFLIHMQALYSLLPDSYFEYTLMQQPNTHEKPCNTFTWYSLQMKNSLSKENSAISCLVRILFKKPLYIHYKTIMTPKKQLVS